MMEILKKYTPKHYNSYLSIVNKIIGDYVDLHKWIKSLGTNDLLVWLKSIANIENNNNTFFEESSIVITLVIKMFCLELDVDHVNITNREIRKLILRLKFALKTELAYRKNVLDKTPTYTILKDIKED